MNIVYPVIFTATQDDKDTYLVYIPDINGMTEGHGLKDAIHMAKDYLGCTFYDKSDDELPQPSDICSIDASTSEFASEGKSFVSLVDLDLTAYRRQMDKKAVRRNVSIPAWLDKAASEEHLNFSRVLQEALKEKLEIAN